MSARRTGYGARWWPILDPDTITVEWLERECDQSEFYGGWPIPGASAREAEERLVVYRRCSGPLCRQYIFAERPRERLLECLGAYPVLLEGIASTARIEAVEALADVYEGCVHCSVVPQGMPVTFFQTLPFLSGPGVAPGDEVEVSFAAIGMRVQRFEQVRFTVCHGPLWEAFQELRLAAGEPPEQAERPLECDMSQTAAYLPLDENFPDEGQFLGRIEAVGQFEHFDLAVYRLEMILQRTEEKDWRVPVFATERALGGYVPQAGDMVSGVLWLQGWTVGVRQ